MRVLISKAKRSIPLILIILLGLGFRLYNVNWDQDFHFHPDERMITMVAERLKLPTSFSQLLAPESPLNPKFFPYGSFPIYLLRAAGAFASNFNPLFSTYQKINLVGRVISSFSDIGVVIIIFLIGKRIWSKKVGLIASSFYSISLLPIQLSHFYAVDTVLNFFIFLTLYFLIVFYDKTNLQNAIKVGIAFGLALATKISATVLLAAIGISLIMDLLLIFLKRLRMLKITRKVKDELINLVKWIFSSLKTPKRKSLLKMLFTLFKFGLIIAVFTCLTFVVFEPYAIIDFDTFISQVLEQRRMTMSAYTFPYTLQYVGTIPYIYQIKNIILWGMGIPLGIFSFFATSWVMLRLIKEMPRQGKENQEAKTLILVSFFIIYFLVTGKFSVKFMRYMLPLYGLLTLFSAYLLNCLLKRNPTKLLGKFLFGIIFFPTLIWSISFSRIYSRVQTRLQVTDWFLKNVPPNATIAVEHWDDRVPIGGQFNFVEMPMYEPDKSNQKWTIVEYNLETADYLILASNRLYVPLQKLSNCNKFKVCYPKTAQYYRDLFSGDLGFKKLAEFTSYPTIPFTNIEIVDDFADESFTVYDHPKIMVFKNRNKL